MKNKEPKVVMGTELYSEVNGKKVDADLHAEFLDNPDAENLSLAMSKSYAIAVLGISEKDATELYGNPKIDMSKDCVCLDCTYYKSDNGCEAFSGGIPPEILLAVDDHDSPRPGDNGIFFELGIPESEISKMDKGDLPGHEFRGNQYTGGGATATRALYRDKFVGNVTASSRTAGGVSDTSASAEKPGLRESGKALANIVRENTEAAFDLAYRAKDRDLSSPEEVKQLVEAADNTVNNKLRAENANPYRTWDVPKFGYASPDKIQPELQDYYKELSGKIAAHEDPISIAAWHEQRYNQIHPFTDGIGRSSKIVTAAILMHENVPLPTYPDRKVFYSHMKDSPKEFEQFFRSLFSANKTDGSEGRWND